MTTCSKTITGKAVASAPSQRTVRRAPKPGQTARTDALREARTIRVKAALAAASSVSSLFK